MKTVYGIRNKDLGHKWLLVSGKMGSPTREDKVAYFETVGYAESEITWRIQHDPEFKTGTYVVTPHATI